MEEVYKIFVDMDEEEEEHLNNLNKIHARFKKLPQHNLYWLFSFF